MTEQWSFSFDEPPKKPQPKLMTFIEARQKGERAGQACAEKAERLEDFDLDAARETALYLLRHYGSMSGEVVVENLKRRGFVGHDDRCFGPVFSVLVKRGLIRCVDFVPRRKGHGTAGGRVWQAVR